MSIRFEYTKQLETSDPGISEHHAWLARRENFTKERPTAEELILVERVRQNPYRMLRTHEYRLLLELAGFTTKLWPPNKKVLWVFFFEGETTRARDVLATANEWHEHCDIRFELTTDRNSSDLRVSFEDAGSWSYIGTDAQGVSPNKATINFGWVDKRVVLHEFGHALGLVHEHQREDANMDWNFDFIYNWCLLTYGWNKQQVNVNFFDVIARTESNHSAHVDRDSIMAYDIPPEFTNSGRTFNAGTELSLTDIQHIGRIYPKVDLLLS